MSYNLTQWVEASYKPSTRKTLCKNCDSMFGERAVNWEHGNVIYPGEPRIVITSDGFGSNSRNVTLCPACASGEIARLESLITKIKYALSHVQHVDNVIETNEIPF